MGQLIGGLTLLASSFVAPFIIQLLKSGTLKAGRARLFAALISLGVAIVWGWISGNARFPVNASAGNILAWMGSMLGYGAAVLAIATRVYDWFETNIFKKVPNLVALITGAKKATPPAGG